MMQTVHPSFTKFECMILHCRTCGPQRRQNATEAESLAVVNTDGEMTYHDWYFKVLLAKTCASEAHHHRLRSTCDQAPQF